MHIFDPLIQQLAFNHMIEMLLYIAGLILSVVLVASIFLYQNSGLKKLLYASIVFSLFCAFLIYEGLEHFYSLDDTFTDIVISLSGLA